MTIYIILVVLLTAASAFEIVRATFFPGSRAAKIANEILFTALTLALIITAGFRLFTGHDYSVSVLMFDRTIGKSITELADLKYEKGYILLSLLAGYISRSAISIFTAIAVLFSALLYIGLKRMTRYPITGLLFFYLFGLYFNSLNFMRSMLGAAIVFNAFSFLRGPEKTSVIPDTGDSVFKDGAGSEEHARSFMRYAALILAASVFHRSTIIMLPFWFILRIRINAVTLPIYLAAGGGILLSIVPAINFITKYVYSSYDLKSTNMLNGIPVFYSLCEGAVLAIAFLWRKRFYDSRWNTVLISASFFAFYFTFVASRHAILGRFSLYFGIAAFGLLVPELVALFAGILAGKIGNQPRPDPVTAEETGADLTAPQTTVKALDTTSLKAAAASSLVCLIAAGALFFGYALANNYNGVVPHQWIWNYNG